MGWDRLCTHPHPYNPKSTGIPGPLLSLSLGSSSMQNPADTPWGSMAKPSSARAWTARESLLRVEEDSPWTRPYTQNLGGL